MKFLPFYIRKAWKLYLFNEEPTIGHGQYPSGLIFRQAFATPGGDKNAQERKVRKDEAL